MTACLLLRISRSNRQLDSATKMAGTGSNQNSLTSTADFFGDDDSSVLPSNRQRTKKWSWIFTPQISAVIAVVVAAVAGIAVADARVIHPDRVQVDFLGFVSADNSSPTPDTSSRNLGDKSTRVLLQVEGRFEPGTTVWKVTTDPGLCTPHPELDSPLGRLGAGTGHEYESVAASVASVPVVSSEPATHLAGKEVYLCARDASKSAVSSPDSEKWTVVDKVLLPQLQEDLILNGGSSQREAGELHNISIHRFNGQKHG